MKTLALLFALACPVSATQIIHQTLKQISHRSEIIAEALVLSREEKYDAAKNKIITLTQLRVIDGIKNTNPGDVLTLYQVGGQYQGSVVSVQGAPVYLPEDRVVFFGRRFHDQVVNYGFSKFQVVPTHHGAQVYERVRGVEELENVGGHFAVKEAKPRVSRSLEEFKAEIRKAL